ncbi:hypothetical protein DE146DRAFT_761063 [Phaeosphaeria sp. MPI-PUGE-AT-0046c]|nr:hypothetical protein DE146DRAFT_761063 [Phaeosphaeria sp. MPI-PUGE-AT-0046c]
MSSTQPTSRPIPYKRLSDVDFEQPTAIIWPILTLTALKMDLHRYDADFHPESWNAYSAALMLISGLFGLPRSTFNWGKVSADQREHLYQDLARASAAFHNAYETAQEEKMFCKYILRWFEVFNIQLNLDIHESRAGIFDYVFDVQSIRVAVSDLWRELAGDILQQHLRALREVPVVPIDAITQMNRIMVTCMGEMLDAIKVFIVVKVDREFLQDQRLPVDFPDRIFTSIKGPLICHMMGACFDLVCGLELGKGKFAVDDAMTTAACTDIFFLKMSEAFSYQSRLIHHVGRARDEYEEEPVPDHVANHQFDQYHDGDWFARELDLVETQDVLRGPHRVAADQVSISMEYEDEYPCELCGECSVQMREIKVCGHVVCKDCLCAQLKIEHECRYKCPYCRAEFFPETA